MGAEFFIWTHPHTRKNAIQCSHSCVSNIILHLDGSIQHTHTQAGVKQSLEFLSSHFGLGRNLIKKWREKKIRDFVSCLRECFCWSLYIKKEKGRGISLLHFFWCILVVILTPEKFVCYCVWKWWKTRRDASIKWNGWYFVKSYFSEFPVFGLWSEFKKSENSSFSESTKWTLYLMGSSLRKSRDLIKNQQKFWVHSIFLTFCLYSIQNYIPHHISAQ